MAQLITIKLAGIKEEWCYYFVVPENLEGIPRPEASKLPFSYSFLTWLACTPPSNSGINSNYM